VLARRPPRRRREVRVDTDPAERPTTYVTPDSTHALPGCAHRDGAGEFALTHEQLAGLLGVRPAGVSEAASEFQAAGLIDYQLGRVTIEDRAALEQAACEGYHTVRAHFGRLFGAPRG
jgi:hypothetical protein